MTILNVWGGERTAVIAMDTLCGVPGAQEWHHGAKITVISHAATVLAQRGNGGISAGLYAPIAMGISSFDQLEGVMLEWLDRSYAVLTSGPHEISEIVETQDVVICGYSHSRGRIATLMYSRDASGWRADGELGNRIIVTGEMYPSDFDAAPEMAQRARHAGAPVAMYELMKRQVAAWSVHPDRTTAKFFCGGRCIVAEVLLRDDGRPTIAVHDMGEL